MERAESRMLGQILVVCVAVVLGPLGSLSVNAPAQTYVFGRADFATGASPVALIAGDFNSDGRLDLATANSGDNTVSVLIGKPDGTFQTHVDYKVGSSPSAIATGDFNGDGKLDLAVTNSVDGTVSILLGNGDGTFQVAGHYATGAAPASVAVGDFNGDGKLDLVTANSGSSSVSILLGHGDGSFDTAVDYATGSQPLSVAVGDLNNDGKSDLAVADVLPEQYGGSQAVVSILLSRGDGTFEAAVNYGTGSGAASSVALGDFNGDGKLDLVAAGFYAVTMLGNGDGTFQSPVDIDPWAEGTGLVAVGDFNRDGILDVVIAGELTICLGDGRGSFDTTNTFLPPTYNLEPSSLAVGDFNGDGALDVAVTTTGSNTASVILGNGDGTLGQGTEAGLGNHYYSFGQMVAADFNGDGKAELGWTYDTGYQCSFGPPYGGISLPGGDYYTGSLPSGLAVADFNGDGRPDVAAVNAGSTYCNGPGDYSVSVLLGNGDGTFQAALTTQPYWSSMVVGDFNGDGTPDLAGSAGGEVSVLFGNGNGTFQAPVGIGIDGTPEAVGDFNGDGKLDLVIADSSKNISVVPGNGGGFGPAIATGATGNSVAVADFNGDGRLDFAAATLNHQDQWGGGGTVSLSLGNGDGTFQSPVNYAAWPVWMAAADFNADGIADLVVLNQTATTLFLGTSDGTLQVLASFGVGGEGASLVAGDFDGDGNTDFAVDVPFDGATGPYLTTFLNRPVIALYPSQLTFSAGSAPETVTVSDPAWAPLKVSSVAITGDFTQTNDCGSVLASGAACTITVTPTQTETAATGSISITDDAPASPHLVSLAVTIPSQPELSMTPESLSFANQQVATTSAKQTVALSSTGNAPLVITSLAATGDFAQTNTCGTSLAPGASCTISVTFTPTAAGSRTGTITITDDAPGSPQVVSLTGTGIETSPMAALSVTGLSFASQVVGTTSAARAVTLTNSGNATLTTTSLAALGDFIETNTCGTSVAAGKSCTIDVSFRPTAPGARIGTITITDNAPGSPHVISLTGTGMGPTVTLSASSMSVGGGVVGTTSGAHALTLTNTGNAALTITSMAISPAAFTETNACGSSLAAGASCPITVTFRPSTAGDVSGILTINDNAPGSPHQISLSGAGEDFNIGPYNLTQSIPAGAIAAYDLKVAPEWGFNQTVALACSGAPAHASCSITPTSTTLDGRNYAVVTLRVVTQGAASAPPMRNRPLDLPGGWLVVIATGIGLLAAMLLAATRYFGPVRLSGATTPLRQGCALSTDRRRMRILIPAAALLLLSLVWVACGGGNAFIYTPPSGGTPSGNYVVTMTASSGHLSHATTVQLKVQ